MDTKEKRRGPRPVKSRTTPSRPVKRERTLRDTDVVYTPPKPFKRGRFLLHLATVAAVVLAVVLGMSIFFKVETVKVAGCRKYSPAEVSEASGIEIGSNLMTISRAQISGSIISNLPYVDTVRVGIILPDTVNIEITELDVVYSVQDTNGTWWLMNADGKLVDSTNAVTAKEHTQVLGVRLESPAIGQQAVAEEVERTTVPLVDTEGEEGEEPQDTTPVDETTPTIVIGVTGAEKLNTVMAVLKELSNNSITGQIDSVDVTALDAVELWYDERFQINLGDTSRLDYKIGALKATVTRMESYESGHLDVSFTNWPDKVGYTPFS